MSFYSVFPDHDLLLALEPEELAGSVLEYLNRDTVRNSGMLNRHNFTSASNLTQYPAEVRHQVAQALTEAWMWLLREGLIAPRPDNPSSDWVFVTRRGKRLGDRINLESYRKANLLPKGQLHPVIAQKCWSSFIRGEYDTAAFAAFKEVEVAVREAGSYEHGDYGVSLMRKAFNPTMGPLTDRSAQASEREALSALFSGAIGSYKNPNSHRHVEVSAEEAVEMIILASHLLRIVDARVRLLTSSPSNT